MYQAVVRNELPPSFPYFFPQAQNTYNVQALRIRDTVLKKIKIISIFLSSWTLSLGQKTDPIQIIRYTYPPAGTSAVKEESRRI